MDKREAGRWRRMSRALIAARCNEGGSCKQRQSKGAGLEKKKKEVGVGAVN